MSRRRALTALALICFATPSVLYAICPSEYALFHGLDSYFSCDDRGHIAALAFALGDPTGTTTGTEDIACERTFGNPRGECLTGGLFGDRRVMIQSDWSNPGIEGCPVEDLIGGRVVIVAQGPDGQGLVASMGFSVDAAGYLVEAAHPSNLAALACSAPSGAPSIVDQTTTPGGEIILNLHFTLPFVFHDCDPGSLGPALGTCRDAFDPAPAFGNIYTSVQPCVSNPDLRRSRWSPTGIGPNPSGDATITVTPPAEAQCLFVGSAPQIGGIESGAIVGFVTIGGQGCGLDLDGDGYLSCSEDCDDGNAGIHPGAAELCDGRDNDCDGQTDEGFGIQVCGVGECQRAAASCVNGQPVDCVPGEPHEETCDTVDNNCNGVVDDLAPQTCDTGLSGLCAAGTLQCAQLETVCVPSSPPVPETCDGLDNDCDGQADEGMGLLTCGVGPCATSVPACVGGQPGVCIPLTGNPEVCDGIDDDCNGVVDDLAPQACDTGLSGICAAGTAQCQQLETVCVSLSPPVPETCDGLDNDCDGQADEGMGLLTCGVGPCATSVPACVGGQPGVCIPLSGSSEVCDGVDNDCDGAIDESLYEDPCSTGLQGACAAGIETCLNATFQCVPIAPPATEVCNGSDDDCDGSTDEGIGYIVCGAGACQRTINGCLAGQPQVCVPGLPSAEVCDGVDNDCDSAVDDGLSGCGAGAPPCPGSEPIEHGLGSYFSCADLSQVAVLAYQLTAPTGVTTAATDIACESIGNGQSGACLGGGRVGDQHVNIEGDWGGAGVSGCPVTAAGPQRVVILVQGTNGQGLVTSLSGGLPGTGYLLEMAHAGVPGTSIVLPLACSAQNGGLRLLSAEPRPGGLVSLDVHFTPPRVFSDCSTGSIGLAAGACTDAFADTSTLGNIYTRLQPCTGAPDLRRGLWTTTGLAAASAEPITLTVTRPPGTQCLHLGATAIIGGNESGGIFSFTTVQGTGCVDNDDDGFTICQNDCEDFNTSVYPGRTEICNNGRDDNCDGLTDEEDTYSCDPLAVVLVSFEATPADGAVSLAWETALEIDSAGFDILRRDIVTDTTTILNPSLIAATGDVQQGAIYSWVDATAVNGVEYEYVLVEMDTRGRRARHPGAKAVPNPTHPSIALISPAYGTSTGVGEALAFEWSPAGNAALMLEVSPDARFADEASRVDFPIGGVERRSGKMSLNHAQARSVDRLAEPSGGSLYWRIVERRGANRVAVSATYRIDYR